MSGDGAGNRPVEIRRALSRRSVESGENLTFVMERFAAQQLLYRLSITPHRDSFVLKGAVLLAVWSDDPYRSTRDIDLLGRGESSAARMRSVFRDMCGVRVGDGLVFEPDSIRVEEIRENQEYGGLRVKLRAYLGNAWVSVQVDVGFGDVVTPEAVEVECPSLLGLSRAVLKAYPRETVVAEKAEAMIRFGMINGRMKDFSDLYYLATHFAFDGRRLCEAIKATFARRRTELPSQMPVALTERFFGDDATIRRWAGFLGTARLSTDVSLQDVCARLRDFVVPVLQAAVSQATFEQDWPAGGPWRTGDQRRD